MREVSDQTSNSVRVPGDGRGDREKSLNYRVAVNDAAMWENTGS
jgi:hypothetical protein